MAEALGVAASVVGVADFAIQLAESIAKLKSFCDKVKDAPEELIEVVDSLQQSRKLLDHIANQPSSFAPAQRSLVDHSLTACSAAIKRIQALTDRLETQMTHSRLRGSLKVALKEKEMQRLLIKLDRAKADLHYAYTLWSSFQLHASQTQLAHHLATFTLTQTTITLSRSEDAAMAVAESGRTGKASKAIIGQRRYKIQVPLWLCAKAWEVSYRQAASGWYFSLRSYRILPYTSLAWRHCWRGDVEGIKTMLERKELSVFDRFANGYSLFSLAVGRGQEALTRFLLQNGVSNVLSAEPGRNLYLYFWAIEEASGEDRSSLMRLIDSYGYQTNGNMVQLFSNPPQQWKPTERIEFWQSISQSHFRFSPIMLDIMEAALARRGSMPMTLYHAVRVLYAIVCSVARASLENATDSWYVCTLVIIKAVQAGLDLHGSDIDKTNTSELQIAHTPLQSLLFLLCTDNYYMTPHLRDVALGKWLEALVQAGVDLGKYGDEERSGIIDLAHAHRLECNFGGLLYGPCLSDWRIWYEQPGDEYCGMFWDLVDHPERAMPGTWEDDDRYYPTTGATKHKDAVLMPCPTDRFWARVKRQRQGLKTTWTPLPGKRPDEDDVWRYFDEDEGCHWSTRSWLEAHPSPNNVVRL